MKVLIGRSLDVYVFLDFQANSAYIRPYAMFSEGLEGNVVSDIWAALKYLRNHELQ